MSSALVHARRTAALRAGVRGAGTLSSKNAYHVISRSLFFFVSIAPRVTWTGGKRSAAKIFAVAILFEVQFQ